MSFTHRPDFDAFHRKIPGHKDAQKRGSYILLYVNQEDLSKPETFLLLLNSRGRNHPSVFAVADGEAMHLGLVTFALVPIFLNCYTMLLNGMTKEIEYGKLVAWDDDENVLHWMDSRKQFLPGKGLLILEAQARLLDFLVCCCKHILHDIAEEKLLDCDYPVVPEPRLNDNHFDDGLTFLTVLYEAAQFRPPPNLDLKKIESLLAARVYLAEDHIHALREDPSYFTDQVLEYKEHRNEMLLDIRGNVHPTRKPRQNGLLWARVIGNALVWASIQLEMLSEIHDQVCKLRVLQHKYRECISPVQDLPGEYLDGLLKSRHYLKQLAQGICGELKQAVPASPPMRNYFVREVPELIQNNCHIEVRQAE